MLLYWIAGIGIVFHCKHNNKIQSYIQSLNPILKILKFNYFKYATRVYWNCLSQSIWKFLQRQPIPTHYLLEMLRLIDPQRKFLPLQWQGLLTKPWNCNGQKDSRFDSFTNIFMTYIETTTLSKTVFRTTVWKCYIHDMFALWDMMDE